MAKIHRETIEMLCRLAGKKKSEISLDLGRHQSYLSHFCNGSIQDMRRGDILAIKQLYDIDIEELDAKLHKETAENPGINLDKKELYKTIYSAVFNAVKAAWEDAPAIEDFNEG